MKNFEKPPVPIPGFDESVLEGMTLPIEKSLMVLIDRVRIPMRARLAAIRSEIDSLGKASHWSDDSVLLEKIEQRVGQLNEESKSIFPAVEFFDKVFTGHDMAQAVERWVTAGYSIEKIRTDLQAHFGDNFEKLGPEVESKLNRGIRSLRSGQRFFEVTEKA